MHRGETLVGVQPIVRHATDNSWSRALAGSGYAAAGWALVFAMRGAYWALGGTVGAETVSEDLQRAAAERDPGLIAVFWVSVGLEVFAAILALALARPGERVFPFRRPVVRAGTVPGWVPLLLAWGAGTLLAGHGFLFVAYGLLNAIGIVDPVSAIRWYALLWGPWFMLGGILFLAAGWSYLQRSVDRRSSELAGVLGGVCGLVLTAIPLVVGAVGA